VLFYSFLNILIFSFSLKILKDSSSDSDDEDSNDIEINQVFIKTNGIELSDYAAVSPYMNDRGALQNESIVKARQMIANGPSDLLYALKSETARSAAAAGDYVHQQNGAGGKLNANSKICSKSYTIIPGADLNENSYGYDKPIIESNANANANAPTSAQIVNNAGDTLANYVNHRKSKEKLNMGFNDPGMTRSAIVSASKSNLSHSRMTQSFISRQNSK
jgi:hypothetical protein